MRRGGCQPRVAELEDVDRRELRHAGEPSFLATGTAIQSHAPMPARRRLHLLVLLQIAQNCAAASKSAAGTTPCSSAFPGDLKVEACGSFCKEAKSKDHCPRCQCRACPFCAPATKGSACASGLAGDSSTADCSDFCAAAGDAGCAYCKCRACSSCLNVALPAPPKPAPKAKKEHPPKGGAPAPPSILGQPCSSTFPGDLKTASCAKFCMAESAKAHCPRCQCKACPFCTFDKHGKLIKDATTSGAPVNKLADKTAIAHFHRDPTRFDYYCAKASCNPWCNKENSHFHCKKCECKACDFCAAQKCEEPKCDLFCDPTFAKAHCGKCKCKFCKFCEGAPNFADSSSSLRKQDWRR